MAASDYVPIFFKNRLHLAGRPQMSTRPRSLHSLIRAVSPGQLEEGVIKSFRVTLGSEPRDSTLSIHPIVDFGLDCEARDFARFCAWVLGDDSPVAFRVTDWFENHF